ncbi:hypothetical protein KC356_g55 [Hortaea werneckii]|nr:hypothetical protein KC356_g55 [Hortaea werneckii]
MSKERKVHRMLTEGRCRSQNSYPTNHSGGFRARALLRRSSAAGRFCKDTGAVRIGLNSALAYSPATVIVCHRILCLLEMSVGSRYLNTTGSPTRATYAKKNRVHRVPRDHNRQQAAAGPRLNSAMHEGAWSIHARVIREREAERYTIPSFADLLLSWVTGLLGLDTSEELQRSDIMTLEKDTMRGHSCSA